jgi:hypothetical protein
MNSSFRGSDRGVLRWSTEADKVRITIRAGRRSARITSKLNLLV